MAGKAGFQEHSRGCLYGLIHFYGDDRVNESELYKELGTLTKEKERWETSILYVSSLLTHDSVKIQAKALWLLGEMGLAYPLSVQDVVPDIASFYNSPVPLLREPAECDGIRYLNVEDYLKLFLNCYNKQICCKVEKKNIFYAKTEQVRTNN